VSLPSLRLCDLTRARIGGRGAIIHYDRPPWGPTFAGLGDVAVPGTWTYSPEPKHGALLTMALAWLGRAMVEG
jgi:hypothetical protein